MNLVRNIALLALLVGAPSPTLAGKTASALVIEIDMVSAGGWYAGTFRAAGTVSDHGSARTLFNYGYAQQIRLDGADGQLAIVIDDIAYTYSEGSTKDNRVEAQLSGTFTVLGGNGAYTAFTGAVGWATGTHVSYPGKCRKGQPGPCGDRKPAEMAWEISLSD